MKKLTSIVQHQGVDLDIYECDCGFHIGLDSTYLDQVDSIKMKCPSCQIGINTAEIARGVNEQPIVVIGEC